MQQMRGGVALHLLVVRVEAAVGVGGEVFQPGIVNFDVREAVSVAAADAQRSLHGLGLFGVHLEFLKGTGGFFGRYGTSFTNLCCRCRGVLFGGPR